MPVSSLGKGNGLKSLALPIDLLPNWLHSPNHLGASLVSQ